MNIIVEDILGDYGSIYDTDSSIYVTFSKLSIEELKYIKEKLGNKDEGHLDWSWVLPYDTCKVLFPERKRYLMISNNSIRTIGDWHSIEKFLNGKEKKYINFISDEIYSDYNQSKVNLIEVKNLKAAKKELQKFLMLKDIIT